jgi:beta-glucuronidase
MRGVNCHDEIPTRQGRAYSEMDFRMLLDEVKALGCNFLRLTHYPPDERLVRMAEQMGLMLWEEIPQWQNIDFTNAATVSLAKQMMAELIRRDKNRCGVILWSVANETPITSRRNEALIDLIAQVRATDPSRLVTMATDKLWYEAASNSVISNDPLCNYLDVVSANKYFGWYAPWEADPETINWNVFPDKPFIYSEFGSESLYGVVGNEDQAWSWSEDHQRKLYEDHVRFFMRIPNLVGTVPWVLFDFRSPYRMNQRFQQEWNRKGLISENGFRKKAWYVMKNYYSTKTDPK